MYDISGPAVYGIVIPKGVSVIQTVFQPEYLRIVIGTVSPAIGVNFGDYHGGQHLQSVQRDKAVGGKYFVYDGHDILLLFVQEFFIQLHQLVKFYVRQ